MIDAEVLFNPNAGRIVSIGMTEERLLRLLESHGISASLRLTDGVAQAVRTFADVQPGRVFIVAGGDGTLFQAVQSSVCRDSAVGIMPLGTANDLARSLGIPLDLHQAAEVIARGQIRRIDLGVAGDRVFIQGAGAGFHAEAFRGYGEHRRHHPVYALLAFLRTLIRWKPTRARLTIDGEICCQEITQVTVANTPIYGPKILVAPGAHVDDGLLDVVVLGRLSRWEILKATLSTLKGSPLQVENLERVAAKSVDIESLGATQIAVHSDGEPIGSTPVHIEVMPSCLKVIVPA